MVLKVKECLFLFQDMENKIRSTLNEIYFGKTKDIVNGLRYCCMSCSDDLNHLLSFYSTARQQRLQQLCFSNCTSVTVCWLSWSVQQIFSDLFCVNSVISYLIFLFKPTFAAHLFSFIFPLLLLSLSSTSPTNLIFYCLFPHISAAILINVCPPPPVNPSVTSPPLLPLLCAPDLLSLCLITKSTGSSRRSCRRSSPSVRSSLTRVRGTAWHGKCVCECVCARLCVPVSRKWKWENVAHL